MTGGPCVVSVAEHAGWAHLVCVAAPDGEPIVIDRRRVTLIEPGLPTMPYHHESIGMGESEANALIARVRTSIAAHASRALQRVIADLAPAHSVVALAIREPTFPELPTSVAAVWKSYRLQCAADGMMYQLEICRAARELHLPVHSYRRGEEAVEIASARRPLGPPWTQDHRRAYAGGIAALAATRGGIAPARRGGRQRKR